jgi:hypothetical protein
VRSPYATQFVGMDHRVLSARHPRVHQFYARRPGQSCAASLPALVPGRPSSSSSYNEKPPFGRTACRTKS